MIYVVIEYRVHEPCSASYTEVEKVKAFSTLEAAEQFMIAEGGTKSKKGNYSVVRMKGKYRWDHFFNVMELQLE